MSKDQENLLSLIIVILVVLFTISLFILPVVWKNALIKEPEQIGKLCVDGDSCESCIDQSGNRTCIHGVCSGGACIIPAQNTLQIPKMGARALLYE